jgi:hypothetical protein
MDTTTHPAGRPLSAHWKISEKLLSDLAEVWAEHGKDVLHRLAALRAKARALMNKSERADATGVIIKGVKRRANRRSAYAKTT